MKTRHCVPRILGITAVGFLAATSALAQDVVGMWNCSMTSEDPSGEGSISFDFDVTFSANGSYTRDGKMNIAIEALQVNASFSVTESGSWTRDGMTLTTTTSEIDMESAAESPSQIEQMITQQMQASARNSPEQSLTIASLTATEMTIVVQGEQTTCQKT